MRAGIRPARGLAAPRVAPRRLSAPPRRLPASPRATDSAATSKELELRAAAMANLQQQLARVENLRAEELKTAISRFEELEEALSMAERTILDLERENAAIKAAARQELAESQTLVQKAMQAIAMLSSKAEVEESVDDSEVGDKNEVEDSEEEGSDRLPMMPVIEDLEAELGQLHAMLADLSVSAPSKERIDFEVPPMLSVAELESAVGKLTESQRKLAAAEKDNALLRAKVEALERAEREASAHGDGSGNGNYVRSLEARNRELAKLLGGSEAGLEEGKRLLVGLLERMGEEVDEDTKP